MKYYYEIIVFVLFSSIVFAKDISIHGIIRDEETYKPLPYANICITDTKYGTASNSNGEFMLRFDKTEQKVLVSYIGYQPDTVSLPIDTTQTYHFVTITLKPKPLMFKEIVVTPGLNPAEKLLSSAYAVLKKHEDKKMYSKAFYRAIVTADRTPCRVREMFYDLLVSTNGIQEWSIRQARDALAIAEIPTLLLYNFSTFTRKVKIAQEWESIFSFLPMIKKSTFIFPVCPNPGKYFDCKIIGYREEGDRTVAIVKVKAKPSVKKRVPLSGTVEIFEDNHQVIQFNICAEGYPELNKGFTRMPKHFPKSFIEKTSLRFKWVNRIVNNEDLKIDRIEAELSFHLRMKKDKKFDRLEKFKSVMLFYEYADSKEFTAKKMTRRENDTRIIKEEIKYDPDFWKKHSHVIEEIPLEKEIVSFFQSHRFYGNLFPGEIIEEK